MIDSYEAMEAILVRVFAECDAIGLCPITDGAQAAFTRLAAQADADPIVGNRLLPTVNEQGFAAIIRFSEAAYGGSADLLLRRSPRRIRAITSASRACLPTRWLSSRLAGR